MRPRRLLTCVSGLDQAHAMRAWVDATPEPSPTSRPAPTYPDVFEGAPACESLPMDEAVAGGVDALLKRGPTKLTGAMRGWKVRCRAAAVAPCRLTIVDRKCSL